MRNRKLVFFVASLLVLFSLVTFAETKKLKSIGRYTLVRIRGDVPTQEVMKRLIDIYAGDIKYGFELAGFGELYLPFMEQLKAAAFEETSLQVGDKLMWMLFRSQGKVKVVQDLEWAGKKPLDVFAFKVEKDYKAYEFVMPRPCGNISLRSITDLEPPAGICKIAVTPEKVNIGDPVTVDMSGSQNAESMEVEVIGPDGAKIATHTLTPDSPKKQTSFDKPGTYTFRGKVMNVKGIASTNPCEAKVMVNAPPVCQLTTSCLPCENFVGKTITIDASGSSDPDGSVAKADFEITDEAGGPVDKFMDTEAPFVWDKIFDKPGTYAISVVVTDDFGAVSEPCRVLLEVTQKRLYFHLSFGPFWARGSHGPYIFGQAGISYWLKPDQWDLVVSAGGAVALKGEPWKSVFLADAVINYHAGSVFFGAGAGFTTAVREGRESDFDIIGNIGFDVFKKPNSRGALLFEFRGPVGEGRTWGDNHKLALGFRVLF